MDRHSPLARLREQLGAASLDDLKPMVGSVAVTTQIDLRAAIYAEGWNDAIRAAARSCDACGGYHDATDEREVGQNEGYGRAEQEVLKLLRPIPGNRSAR